MTFEIFLIEWWNKKKDLSKILKIKKKNELYWAVEDKNILKSAEYERKKKEANKISIFPLQPKMIYFSLCMKSLIILITKNKDTPNSRYIKSQGTNLILSFIAIFTPLSP